MKRPGFANGLVAVLAVMLAATAMAAPDDPRAGPAAPGPETLTVKPGWLPPIFLAGERIVFQGDVTTDGARWHTFDLKEPIWQDYAYILAAGYGSAYPEKGFVFINRTIQGDDIGSLAGRWQRDTLALKPDVISISSGVNDLRSGIGHGRPTLAGHFEKAYDDLLASTVRANPHVKLILCAPFVLPSKYTTPHWDEWMDLIRQVEGVVDKLGAKYHAPAAHFQKLFPWPAPDAGPVKKEAKVKMPTYGEHRRMADEWISTYQSYYGPPVSKDGNK